MLDFITANGSTLSLACAIYICVMAMLTSATHWIDIVLFKTVPFVLGVAIIWVHARGGI